MEHIVVAHVLAFIGSFKSKHDFDQIDEIGISLLKDTERKMQSISRLL